MILAVCKRRGYMFFFFLLGFFFNFACPYISSHEAEERRGKGIVVGLGETDFFAGLMEWGGGVGCRKMPSL